MRENNFFLWTNGNFKSSLKGDCSVTTTKVKKINVAPKYDFLRRFVRVRSFMRVHRSTMAQADPPKYDHSRGTRGSAILFHSPSDIYIYVGTWNAWSYNILLSYKIRNLDVIIYYSFANKLTKYPSRNVPF